jgi:hypothetical protein
MNNTESEITLLKQALLALKEVSGLEARMVSYDPRTEKDGAWPDAAVRISADDFGQEFYVLIKRRLMNDSLGYVISVLREMRPRRGVLVTSHVSPRQAEKLRLAGTQFLDAAGNAYLNDPPLYVLITGRRPAEPLPKGKPTRAFTMTGVKMLFTLLCNPKLVGRTYREIAAEASVSLGAVAQVLDDMKKAGHLLETGTGARRLLKREELVRRWVEAYAERLRPKLLLGRYSNNKPDWWKEARPGRDGACWGGEVAAAKITRYLKPQVKTIYAPTKMAALQVKFGLKPDDRGDTEILKKFWAFNDKSPYPDTAPALLVYADLVASGDDRNIETARIIYDRYLDRSLGED